MRNKVGRSRIDLSGRRFGKLIVIESVAGVFPHKCLCLCDCGLKKIVRAADLTRSNHPTKSCGCILRKPNDISIDGAIAYIKFSGGEMAIIDASDVDIVSRWTWWIENKTGYVRGQLCGKKVSLHRLLMNAEIGQFVDHIDGDKLDNRKRFLRICSSSENGANRKSLNVNNTSGFRGVSRIGQRWFATIMFEKKTRYLGTFDTPEEAAKAYNLAAMKYHGEFATLNKLE